MEMEDEWKKGQKQTTCNLILVMPVFVFCFLIEVVMGFQH